MLLQISFDKYHKLSTQRQQITNKTKQETDTNRFLSSKKPESFEFLANRLFFVFCFLLNKSHQIRKSWNSFACHEPGYARKWKETNITRTSSPLSKLVGKNIATLRNPSDPALPKIKEPNRRRKGQNSGNGCITLRQTAVKRPDKRLSFYVEHLRRYNYL